MQLTISDDLSPRLKRELKTIYYMLLIYCRNHHGSQTGVLCPACLQLQAYALARLQNCPYGDQKPTCANCPIHCYKSVMQKKTREIMKFSGPRMMFQHPVLAMLHLLDGKKTIPITPSKATKQKPDCHNNT